MALETLVFGFGALVFLVLLYIALTYNSLISLKIKIDRSWAQIDVFLKRRYELIPRLVETVKGYAKHERELLIELTRARGELISGSTSTRAKANELVTRDTKTLFAVAEKYPELKASENFKKLQEELVATENSIAFVRIGYNDTVAEFNVALRSFPSSIVAGMFNFAPREFFAATDGERKSVKLTI